MVEACLEESYLRKEGEGRGTRRGGKAAPENVLEIAALGKKAFTPQDHQEHAKHSLPSPSYPPCPDLLPKPERLLVPQRGHWPTGSHLPLVEGC